MMISIDGMKPEYVLGADAHKLKIPSLRRFVRDGCYAEAVTGIWPTVTYPSHTTLVTGVGPAEHGVVANEQFDPFMRFKGAWYWYASSIKVPTLWQAAHRHGLSTASIGWPVTVGAEDIDFLIPEYWRINGPTTELNPMDRSLIAALSQPTGLIESLERSAGPYLQGNDTSVEGDEIKTRYALELLRSRKPAFMTLHLSSLDHVEHATGIFSVEAAKTLEAIDAMVGELVDAAWRNDRNSVLVVVSDHGFTDVHREINLFPAFIEAGFISIRHDASSDQSMIDSWRAEPWLAGGMAAVVLKDPADTVTLAAVERLLQRLQATPSTGIQAILNAADLERIGAFPGASFLVQFKPGFLTGERLTGELVLPIPDRRGSHGFAPLYPEMHAAFFIMGSGVFKHRDLGLIDMLRIAPTVAQILGVKLPTTHAAVLPVEP